jgi:NAD(P)-dependent dehydrogenase (short-subunit alcohol dehydrogenase family)
MADCSRQKRGRALIHAPQFELFPPGKRGDRAAQQELGAMDITNQIAAIVTGGASGLGRATAEALRAAGAKVAIFDMNRDLGQAVAAGIGATFCEVNVNSEESCAAGFAKARAANGQERILIGCAGGGAGRPAGKIVSKHKETGAIKRYKTDDFAAVVDLNLVATYRVVAMAAEGMAALDPISEDGERGAIVITASVAAQDGQVGQSPYGSAKAGVNGLVLPVARDLMDLGIRINSIMPGIFATPPMLGAPKHVLDALAASVPFPKRLGRPDEFAAFAVELVRNAYCNGQTYRLDGAIRMPPR